MLRHPRPARYSPPLPLARQVIEAGANAIVSGSGVFGAKDYAAAIKVGALNARPCSLGALAAPRVLTQQRGCTESYICCLTCTWTGFTD